MSKTKFRTSFDLGQTTKRNGKEDNSPLRLPKINQTPLRAKFGPKETASNSRKWQFSIKPQKSNLCTILDEGIFPETRTEIYTIGTKTKKSAWMSFTAKRETSCFSEKTVDALIEKPNQLEMSITKHRNNNSVVTSR